MAGTKYAYVKSFELPDPLLPGTFLVLRVDGHAFHRFTDVHGFIKPNDERGLRLMDRAAQALMDEFKDIILAFGESDEFSFLLRSTTQLYNRRHAKILTTLVSAFTAAYIFHWSTFFPEVPLQYPPTFDGRIVQYPSAREVRDYFSWRQADTHINNLYNTVFWALVQQGGQTTTEAHTTLRGTVSKQKHEILFSRFNINYNNIDARYRKGSVLVREAKFSPETSSQSTSDENPANGPTPTRERGTSFISMLETPLHTPISPSIPITSLSSKQKKKTVVRVLHEDIIGDDFWIERPSLFE